MAETQPRFGDDASIPLKRKKPQRAACNFYESSAAVDLYRTDVSKLPTKPYNFFGMHLNGCEILFSSPSIGEYADKIGCFNFARLFERPSLAQSHKGLQINVR